MITHKPTSGEVNVAKMTDLNFDIRGRLINWKFKSAEENIKTSKLKPQSKRTIRMLSRMFRDCGWFDGDVAQLIIFAVDSIFRDEGWEMVE